MTLQEKFDIQHKLAKRIINFLAKNNVNTYDAFLMVIGFAQAHLRMIIRENYPGCKKNSAKAARTTKDFLLDYIEEVYKPHGQIQPWARLRDDNDNESLPEFCERTDIC